MRIILSRKGFDSEYGKQPNPILPNGTLLSLPIPDENGNNAFSSLLCNELKMNYYEIIYSLKPRTKIKGNDTCHLDPDLRKDVRDRLAGWKPAFGQADTALHHLQNKKVGVGDLFLFFGWFKETEMNQGKLVYKRVAKDLHVIYGYMQVGDTKRRSNAPDWLKDHPHVGDKKERDDEKNLIYLPTEKLSFMPDVNGCGLLKYRKDRILTKEGMSKSKWNLPDFFKEVEISYHPNPWKDNYFQSAAKGQEFVMEATPEILEWVKHIIR
jgi:transposase